MNKVNRLSTILHDDWTIPPYRRNYRLDLRPLNATLEEMYLLLCVWRHVSEEENVDSVIIQSAHDNHCLTGGECIDWLPTVLDAYCDDQDVSIKLSYQDRLVAEVVRRFNQYIITQLSFPYQDANNRNWRRICSSPHIEKLFAGQGFMAGGGNSVKAPKF